MDLCSLTPGQLKGTLFIELQINNKNNEYKFSRELGFDINWGTKEEYNEWMKRENMDEYV